jgi:hypothetical protein
MKKLADFTYFVAITPQEQISVVVFCPQCGMSMTFTDCGGPLSITSAAQQHQCFQTVVSVPK